MLVEFSVLFLVQYEVFYSFWVIKKDIFNFLFFLQQQVMPNFHVMQALNFWESFEFFPGISTLKSYSLQISLIFIFQTWN